MTSKRTGKNGRHGKARARHAATDGMRAKVPRAWGSNPKPVVAAPPKTVEAEVATTAAQVATSSTPAAEIVTTPPGTQPPNARTSGSVGNSRGWWCPGANTSAGAKVEVPGKQGDHCKCPECGRTYKTLFVKTKAGEARHVPFHYIRR